MDEETFRRLATNTRLQDRALEMARQILIDGLNPAAAGAAHGVSRQAAKKAADRVLAQLRTKEIPEDWQTVTVVVPVGLGRVVRYLEEISQARAGLKPYPTVPLKIRNEEVETIAEMLSIWAKGG